MIQSSKFLNICLFQVIFIIFVCNFASAKSWVQFMVFFFSRDFAWRICTSCTLMNSAYTNPRINVFDNNAFKHKSKTIHLHWPKIWTGSWIIIHWTCSYTSLLPPQPKVWWRWKNKHKSQTCHGLEAPAAGEAIQIVWWTAEGSPSIITLSSNQLEFVQCWTTTKGVPKVFVQSDKNQLRSMSKQGGTVARKTTLWKETLADPDSRGRSTADDN